MKYTTNYNLKKPDLTDPVDIQDINDNMDEIDSHLSEMMNKADLSTMGWFKDEKTGLIIQWVPASLTLSNSRANSKLAAAITFPHEILYSAVSCRGLNDTTSLEVDGIIVTSHFYNLGAFDLYARYVPASGYDFKVNCTMFAIGY